MDRREFMAMVAASATLSSGCGTIMHAERRNQPHSDQIDWKIAALDALGLLLFFVPGVVAFAVDFHTGAIYLPAAESFPEYGSAPAPSQPPAALAADPSQSAPNSPPPTGSAQTGPTPMQVSALQTERVGLIRRPVPQDELDTDRISLVVSEHIGQPVTLGDDTRVSSLSRVDEFPAHLAKHHRDRRFGAPIRDWLQRRRDAKNSSKRAIS